MRSPQQPVPLSVAVQDPRLLGGLFDDGWWPRQLDLLDSLDGPERRYLWAIGRQSGKDVMIAALAVQNAALRPDLDLVLPKGMWREILVCCPRQDQAEDFISTCAAHLENSPVLSQVATIKSDRIEFRIPRVDGKGRSFVAKVRIISLPANARTTRGKRASLLIFNEQAHADETAGPGSAERLWTALTPSLRKFGKHAKIVCISTPDGQSGKFFELCESAQGGSLANTSRFEQWATWDVDPTVTEEQKAAWRADLGQALFEQEYGAQFVDAAGSFFDLSEVEFTDMPARPGDGENWIAALDPAFHADSFGVALVGRSKEDSDELLVGMVEGLKPKGAAKSFDQRRGREDATLAAIGEIIAPYEPHAIVSDLDQWVAATEACRNRGSLLECRPLAGTRSPASSTRCSPALARGGAARSGRSRSNAGPRGALLYPRRSREKLEGSFLGPMVLPGAER